MANRRGNERSEQRRVRSSRQCVSRLLFASKSSCREKLVSPCLFCISMKPSELSTLVYASVRRSLPTLSTLSSTCDPPSMLTAEAISRIHELLT